jgi:hypothetical protein
MREKTKQRLRRMFGLSERTVMDAVILPRYLRGEPEKHPKIKQTPSRDIYDLPQRKPLKNPLETNYQTQGRPSVDIF